MRLIETLFNKEGYNPLIRPVENLTETVTVKFGLAMIQLINVVCISLLHSLSRRVVLTLRQGGRGGGGPLSCPPPCLQMPAFITVEYYCSAYDLDYNRPLLP